MKRRGIASDMPHLPQEIVRDILKRLPVKSLIQFQCVCKDWKNLIKSQSFMAEHLQQSSNQNPFLILERNRYDTRLPWRLHLLDSKLQVREIQKEPYLEGSTNGNHSIVGYCNGLLLVGNSDKPHPSLSLWNPATKSVRHIPLTDCYAFDHRSVTGFGFSPIVNDYVIVRTCALFNYPVSRAYVFSLSRGSWKRMRVGALKGVRLCNETVTANGAIFWWGFKLEGEDEREVLISFDIAKEVFTLIRRPFSYQYHDVGNLTVYQNKLAILCGIWEVGGPLINLWVLEEGTCASRKTWSWTKRYASIPPSCTLNSMTIWGNEIVCKFASKKDSERRRNVLYMMNLTSYEVKRFVVPYCGRVPDICNYVESLY